MLRRVLALFAALMLLFSYSAAENEAEGRLFVRPGRTERIRFNAAEAGAAVISLLQNEQEMFRFYEEFEVAAGENHFVWNGMDASGAPVPAGEYALQIAYLGKSAAIPVTVGEPGPVIEGYVISDAAVTPGREWTVTAAVNMPGELSISLNIGGVLRPVAAARVEKGENTLSWDGRFEGRALAAGYHMLALQFRDDTGFYGNPHYIGINLLSAEKAEEDKNDAADSVLADGANVESDSAKNDGGEDDADKTDAPRQAEPAAAPAMRYKPPTADEVPESALGGSYWTLPVGEWNEDAIWKVMMQPMTVIKGIGKRDIQRETYRLRAAPDASMKNDNVLGEITCESQGVNVLQTLDNGWSLVEAFNSSYGPNCAARPGWGHTDDLLRGYVETGRLTTLAPREDYGILIDKLTQKMHVFKEGKLFSTLKISTGLPSNKQPWNETPAGEFAMVSRTGGFQTGNLYCDMAMRVNGGSLMHEVPFITNESTGYKDYSAQESQLGKKASHGCIRVQRKKNGEGLNMQWLWNNIKVNTKVLIWDDMPGRYYEYPADDTPLYYNPKGGKYYHSDANCRSIKSRYLPLKGQFTYAELDNSEYQKLTPCKTCHPPARRAELDKLNKENGF